MDNEKKVVLVSGASSGIGKAIAEYLAAEGHKVYAGARSYREQTGSDHENLKKVYMDVTKTDIVDSLVDNIVKTEGRLDVLVNCAAVYTLGSVEDLCLDEYRQVIDTNLFGTLSVCKAAIPHMRRQKHGYIINLSSIAGVVPIPFHSPYVMSKFAIEGLTQSMSMELKDFGINVVMIEPGDHRDGSLKCRKVSKSASLDTSPYYKKFIKVSGKLEWEEANGSDPKGVGRLVAQIINRPRPALRYTIGKFEQKLSMIVKKFVPGRMFEKIIDDYYTKHNKLPDKFFTTLKES
ncbi:MAG TPA: SDR family oxidoreductase [Clostridiaceae bacterium]|nr:SDR family oxidoreductase [Clostridiaceae bacterium]